MVNLAGPVATAWAAKEAVRGIYTQPPETAAEYLSALTDDTPTLRKWGRES